MSEKYAAITVAAAHVELAAKVTHASLGNASAIHANQSATVSPAATTAAGAPAAAAPMVKAALMKVSVSPAETPTEARLLMLGRIQSQQAIVAVALAEEVEIRRLACHF